jgi:hypothetical protein
VRMTRKARLVERGLGRPLPPYALDLHRAGLGLRKIRDKITAESGVEVSHTVVGTWLESWYPREYPRG